VLLNPFRRMGELNNLAGIQQLSKSLGLDQRSKMEEVVPKVVRREARMRDYPEGGELDRAEDVHRCCKSGQFKRERRGRANSSEENEGIWQNRESCEKDFVYRWRSRHALSLQWLGLTCWEHGRRGVLLRFWRASLPVRYREVQRDREPTGSLELYERRGSQRGPKYPRRTLVEETLGRGVEGKSRLKVACIKMGAIQCCSQGG